jgi:hypothetical protein
MFVDFNDRVIDDGAHVMNGRGFGIGENLAHVRFDPGMLRPYIDDRGRRCVTINTGQMRRNDKTGNYEPVYRRALVQDLMERGIYSPVFNATSLRKGEWIELDKDGGAGRSYARLRAWADLAAAQHVRRLQRDGEAHP